jgi:hypothetical protein
MAAVQEKEFEARPLPGVVTPFNKNYGPCFVQSR